MKILFSKKFRKEFKEFPTKIQKRITERIVLFSENDNNPLLNSHALHGEYAKYYSINISGDIRVLYEFIDKNTVLFVKVGTNNKLYE